MLGVFHVYVKKLLAGKVVAKHKNLPIYQTTPICQPESAQKFSRDISVFSHDPWDDPWDVHNFQIPMIVNVILMLKLSSMITLI